MKRKPLLYGLILVAVLAAWAAFRPERLFINARVNETLPDCNRNQGYGNCNSIRHLP